MKSGWMAAACVAATVTGASAASAADITGSIYFNGGFINDGYDPVNGGVPPGFGNETSNTVAVGPGVEFGFQDSYNRDTADFTGATLIISDQVLSTGASPTEQIFTADTPGYFNGATLASSTYDPGLTYNVSGNTLTINWAGEYSSGSAFYTATFDLPNAGGTAAPEPATWALLIGGFGCVGAVMRRRSSAVVRFA